MSQAAVVQFALEPLAVELREIAVPEIGDTDVLLRVGAVSVCGSDVHQAYNTHSWPVNVPVVLGHEFAGTVARAGKAVTAFREGMAVHGKFGQPCPVCRSPVQRIRYAENETNYCARCQTGGRLLADRALSRLLKSDWPRSLDELE